jgi:hypothetical protein
MRSPFMQFPENSAFAGTADQEGLVEKRLIRVEGINGHTRRHRVRMVGIQENLRCLAS